MNRSTTPTKYSMTPAQGDERLLDTPETIERLADDMRRRSGGELPRAFCIEQVKRQLAGQRQPATIANSQSSAYKSSVFHAWAISE